MKNYWLERKKNKGFDYIVAQYQSNDISADKFALALYGVAEKAVDYISRNSTINIDRDDAIQECVMIGFDKVKRYKPTKDSKAYNFFVTIMLGHLRQIWRTSRNYQDLKKNYEYYIKTTKGQVIPFAPEQIKHIDIS